MNARSRLTIVVVLTMLTAPGAVVAQDFGFIAIPKTDAGALRGALTNAGAPGATATLGLLGGVYSIDSVGQGEGTSTALPTIDGTIVIVGAGDEPAILRASGTGYRAFRVMQTGSLTLQNVSLENFNLASDGGLIFATGGSVTIRNATISNNRSGDDGGAIKIEDGSLTVVGSTIAGNTASDFGGGLSIGDSTAFIDNNTFRSNAASRGGALDLFDNLVVTVSNNVFDRNTASVFGCFVFQETSPNGPEAMIVANTIINGNCANAVFEQPMGRAQLSGNTLVHGDSTDGIHATGGLVLANNTIVRNNLLGSSMTPNKQGCRDFGSMLISSAGGNLGSDATCFLTQPTDQQNVNPRLGIPDSKGSIPLLAGSPGIDRGGAALRTVGGRPTLPCGYKDSRGLGRPQDRNNDGTYACDSGSYEVQGGADITGSYSAAYFDTSRAGEGTLIEILDGGIAFVAKFPYRPNGGTAGVVGVGNVGGHSVVLDDFLLTTGGVFGPAFDQANVRRVRVGGASYNFSTCDSSARPGRLAFAAESGNGYEDLLVNASRLTSIVPCSGAPSANAGRAGSFFSPTRSGEGILVQFLPDGRVFLVWYTYDPQGDQFWIVSGDVTVAGNVVTAQMLYPEETTSFGSQFNSSQIGLQPWGTVTLTYSGCDNLTFAYTSTVADFGSGQYPYQRLTRLRGTTCTR